MAMKPFINVVCLPNHFILLMDASVKANVTFCANCLFARNLFAVDVDTLAQSTSFNRGEVFNSDNHWSEGGSQAAGQT